MFLIINRNMKELIINPSRKITLKLDMIDEPNEPEEEPID